MSIVESVLGALTDYMQPTAHVARAVGVSTRRAACCLAMLRRRGAVCSLKWDEEDPTSATMWSLARHRSRSDAESAARAIQRSIRKGMRSRQRWRWQSARLIVEADYDKLVVSLGPWDEPGTEGHPVRVEELTRLVHQGAAFSVPRVRAYCERMVALASAAPVSGDLAEARGRMAQRLLDTLNGRCPWNPHAVAQHDVCPTCDGDGYYLDWELWKSRLIPIRGDCHHCWTTGKNNRGSLPGMSEADRGEENRLRSFRVDRDPNYIPF